MRHMDVRGGLPSLWCALAMPPGSVALLSTSRALQVVLPPLPVTVG